tara:strand:+ start:841 stop:2328 length:1488 start_codon:yes stop_codon:yes gene_type:complete
LASSYNVIDSFENWNPNIQSLADRLLIGPQRDLLEKVQNLNNRHGLNLNITRTYRWSPGYMDQIKDFMVDKYLQKHMKRKISTFFKQIDEKSWMLNGLSRTLNQIDNTMAEKRRTRAVFQDNSDIIEDRWEILHKIIVKETKKVTNTMEHIQFNTEVLESENQKTAISFTWAFPEMDMNIFVGQEYFPVEMGKVEVNITFDIDDLVTQLCNDGLVQFVTIGDDENCGIRFSNLSRGSSYGRIAGWYEPKYIGGQSRLLHPFISAYANDIRRIDGNPFTSTCLGDLTGRIWSELSEMDLLSVTLTLQQWLTTFNARDTRPLNNLRQTFWGLPERLNDFNFLAAYPTDPAECMYPESEYSFSEDTEAFDTNYCDTVNCALKVDCNYYRFVNNIEEPEAAEVVDSDADNIHGGEYAQTHTAGRDEQFDPEAIVEQVNAVNRELGLNDDGTPRDYNEEMDRINDDDPMSVPLPENPLTEEQALEQLLRQQYRVIDIGRE